MLSRLALRSGAFGQLARAPLSQRAITAVAVRAASTSGDPFVKAHELYNSPVRDHKNFPNLKQPIDIPPVRLGFIPSSWFDAFYSKTGVTGPYLFTGGLIATLLSKEIWVVDHGFTEVLAFWSAWIILIKAFGKPMSAWLDKKTDKRIDDMFFEPMKKAKAHSLDLIKQAHERIDCQDGQKHLFQAKRENVDLQLESIYRQRLHDAHMEVKNRLDYMLEVQNTKRRVEQEHMVHWIIDNVVKSITPQQEKEALNKCITDLKSLARTA